jgi:hypothetical protein
MDSKQLKVVLTRAVSKDDSAKKSPRRKILKEKQISEMLDADEDDQVGLQSGARSFYRMGIPAG